MRQQAPAATLRGEYPPPPPCPPKGSERPDPALSTLPVFCCLTPMHHLGPCSVRRFGHPRSLFLTLVHSAGALQRNPLSTGQAVTVREHRKGRGEGHFCLSATALAVSPGFVAWAARSQGSGCAAVERYLSPIWPSIGPGASPGATPHTPAVGGDLSALLLRPHLPAAPSFTRRGRASFACLCRPTRHCVTPVSGRDAATSPEISHEGLAQHPSEGLVTYPPAALIWTSTEDLVRGSTPIRHRAQELVIRLTTGVGCLWVLPTFGAAGRHVGSGVKPGPGCSPGCRFG